MAIHGPLCSGEVPSEQVNIQADTAMCSSCREMFRPSAVIGPRSNDTGEWAGDDMEVTGKMHNFVHKLSDGHQQLLVNEFTRAHRRLKQSAR